MRRPGPPRAADVRAARRAPRAGTYSSPNRSSSSLGSPTLNSRAPPSFLSGGRRTSTPAARNSAYGPSRSRGRRSIPVRVRPGAEGAPGSSSAGRCRTHPSHRLIACPGKFDPFEDPVRSSTEIEHGSSRAGRIRAIGGPWTLLRWGRSGDRVRRWRVARRGARPRFVPLALPAARAPLRPAPALAEPPTVSGRPARRERRPRRSARPRGISPLGNPTDCLRPSGCSRPPSPGRSPAPCPPCTARSSIRDGAR